VLLEPRPAQDEPEPAAEEPPVAAVSQYTPVCHKATAA
jgi:hypothetical protein